MYTFSGLSTSCSIWEGYLPPLACFSCWWFRRFDTPWSCIEKRGCLEGGHSIQQMVDIPPAMGEVPHGWISRDVRAFGLAIPVQQRVRHGAGSRYRLGGGDGRSP